MIRLDTRGLAARMRTIESIAVIPRVASTNVVARRIMEECVDNDLSMPQAIIVAGEQYAGRGRNTRTWSSPAGKGIYATAIITRPVAELPLIPLAMANIVASFLRDVFAVDARVKWPNDILVDGRKIAGILIEARVQDDHVHLLIGIGINVEAATDESRPNSVAIREVTSRPFGGIVDATEAFIEHLDERISVPQERDPVLDEWRARCIHRSGDRITCVLAERTVTGTWGGIDEHGRAVLRSGGETLVIAAGDLIVQTP
jgi:BirA family transcriptional regulator, biotin operon repressor / biotin---[acetyl-CoA-carboxylase] ligase